MSGNSKTAKTHANTQQSVAERCPHWPNEKPVRGAHSELVQSTTKFMATRGFFIQKLGKLLCLWAFTFSQHLRNLRALEFSLKRTFERFVAALSVRVSV